jgi:hypothetical protein
VSTSILFFHCGVEDVRRLILRRGCSMAASYRQLGWKIRGGHNG